MVDPLYTCCEDGMLSQAPPTDRSGLCPACQPVRLTDDARDAARYRWLRKHQHYVVLEHAFGYSYAQIEHWSNEQNHAKLDAAVDTARGVMASSEPNYNDAARKLWMLLDDIDTLDDACRADDAAFRKHTRVVQRKRFAILSGEQMDVLLAHGVAGTSGGQRDD